MSVLTDAESLISGDRNRDYGNAKRNFEETAAIWEVILQTKVTPEQVALCMAGFKLAREAHKHKRDNIVDMCGYVALLEQLYEGKNQEVGGNGEVLGRDLIYRGDAIELQVGDEIRISDGRILRYAGPKEGRLDGRVGAPGLPIAWDWQQAKGGGDK